MLYLSCNYTKNIRFQCFQDDEYAKWNDLLIVRKLYVSKGMQVASERLSLKRTYPKNFFQFIQITIYFQTHLTSLFFFALSIVVLPFFVINVFCKPFQEFLNNLWPTNFWSEITFLNTKQHQQTILGYQIPGSKEHPLQKTGYIWVQDRTDMYASHLLPETPLPVLQWLTKTDSAKQAGSV